MTKVTQLLAAAAVLTLSATPVFAQAKGPISVAEEGREVTVKAADGKENKVTVSGSRTKITIKGATAERAALEDGMVCAVTPQSGEAATIVCD